MADVIRRIDGIFGAALSPAVASPVSAAPAGRAAAAQPDSGPVAGAGGGALPHPEAPATGGTRLLPVGGGAFAPSLSAAPLPAPGKQRTGFIVAGIGATFLVALAVLAVGIGLSRRGQPSADSPGSEVSAPVREASAPSPGMGDPPSARPTESPPHGGSPVAAGADVTTIEVSTTPTGAELWVADEVTPRGVTPVRVSFARGSESHHLRLRAPGYLERTVTVDGDRDSVVAVELQRLRPARPAPAVRSLARGDHPVSDKRAAGAARRVAPAREPARSPSPGAAAAKASDSQPEPQYRRMAD